MIHFRHLFLDEINPSMDAASLADIRKELAHQSPAELMELVVRLARFRLDNKALIGYWLFDRTNQAQFLAQVHLALDEALASMNFSSAYFVKKSLRKWQRQVNLYGRICGEPWMLADLQGYYVWTCLRAQKKVMYPDYFVELIRAAQRKFNTLLLKLEPDMQHDMQRQFERWINS